METKKLKNWLLLSKQLNLFTNKKWLLPFFICCLQITFKAQNVANYITNGGFESYYGCGIAIENAKGWRTIDSSSAGAVVYCNTCIPNVPDNIFTYQWPRNGQSYGMTGILCFTPQCSPYPNRGYFRNRLKDKLVNGKTYCVKLYANLSNPSSYGISNIGFFFVDNSIDTITKISAKLTYINPQFENPSSNIIVDTLNWTLITGTFVANGTEKNCVIGNFRSDAATTKTLTNSAYLPAINTTILIDDVSCIPIDLPAYAGPDVFGIPGNTVYIGRPQDVGIDEACTWYNITNTTTPIANAAGITVTVGVTSQTYIVKQDICGNIKYDTVAVYASAVGMVSLSGVEDWGVNVYPNPAKDLLYVEVSHASTPLSVTSDISLSLTNALGQVIREEALRQAQQPIEINVKDIPNGVYFIKVSLPAGKAGNKNGVEINKKFVVEH
jgi:hypothetical protein